ncbi:hypothetical protein NDA16_000191 [Ustilago loliicola]|nr:hypothetical protein NDA16_000191 [Ustilago loliicola]
MSQNTAQSPHADSMNQAGHAPRRFHTPKHGWLHEVEKRVVGQTPKGTPPATPRHSESHGPRPSSGDLDREVETIFRRTARYGGDYPRDPQDRAYDITAESETSTRVPSSPTHRGANKSKHEQTEGQENSSQDNDNDDSSDQGRPRGNPDESQDPNQIAQEFQIGTVTATLITSLFLAGYCLGPIIWSTTSELVGRKIIFSISMLMYTLFILGQALAKNPETLFVTRFISGVCAAAPLTNAGGVIADIWDPVGRGYAMSLFSCAVFIGPVMGPIIGGFVTQSYLAWRWVFWIMMIFAGLCWVITVLFLPETFAPILLV